MLPGLAAQVDKLRMGWRPEEGVQRREGDSWISLLANLSYPFGSKPENGNRSLALTLAARVEAAVYSK